MNDEEYEAYLERRNKDMIIISNPNYGVIDNGPWEVSEDGHSIQSDDFTHDVAIKISGDFWDDVQRKNYALNIAKKLNRKFDDEEDGKV